MKTEEIKEHQIIYTYMHKSGIMILRKRNGKWIYTYRLSQVVKQINILRKRDGKREYETYLKNDLWYVCEEIGMLIEWLLVRCQKEYA